MNKTEQLEYGIQYEVIKLNEKSYILFPLTIIEGYSVGDIFYSDTIQKVLYDKSSLAESTLIDSIINVEKLKETYDFDDLDFLKDYYLTEEKDYIILVELTDKKIIKRKINVAKLTKKENSEIYERKNNEPVITLNNDALDDILSSDTIFEIKDKVARYKKLLNSFEEKEKKEGITSITVTNGHVSEVNVNKKVSTYTKDNNSKALTSPNTPNDINNFSVRGLEQYLKERVFGHDEQIRSIATKLIMNYRSSLEYGTESILLVGPTGTGKTVTILSAAEYFNLPFVQVNTANLVPQGIKGPSLEDYLYSLIVNSQYDINRAQRGFIFLDEFDKIGKDALDMKETVKQIFLKFIEGDTFMIDKPSDDYNFNTKMLNKTFAGAFQELFETKKTIGFGGSQEETIFNPSQITNGDYFSKELVTRIEHVFAYNPLSREDQKRAILESKLSKLQLKKKRYEEEFGVELIALDSYIEAILDQLSSEEKSMRDLNNLILKTLREVEYELLNNEGKVQKLILSSDTVENPQKFILQ